MLNIIKYFPSVILNRLRGTGLMFTININGNILYSLYFFILVSLLSWVFNYHWEWSFLALVLYLIGESFAWGKWVGYLTSDKENPEKQYDNDDGLSFPYTHFIANFFIDQTKHYYAYCVLALSIRGIIWWLPFYILLGWLFNQTLISVIIGVIVGSLFCLAAILSKKFSFTFEYDLKDFFKDKIGLHNSIVYECKNNWEREEILYGIIHELGLWSLIVISIILQLW